MWRTSGWQPLCGTCADCRAWAAWVLDQTDDERILTYARHILEKANE